MGRQMCIRDRYEHALTEMGVDMSRRIDAVKAEYTKSAEPLQKLSLIHI